MLIFTLLFNATTTDSNTIKETGKITGLYSHQFVTDPTTRRAVIGHVYLVKVARFRDSL
jgi:hypothetical protein